jgi:hypothetical protein
MTRESAQSAVTGSALVVGGIYLYRRLVEEPKAPTRKGSSTLQQLPGELLGQGPAPPVSRFVVGWGFVFVVLSLTVEASPELGGYGAILVALGALLGNGVAVSKDLGRQLEQGQKPAGTAAVPFADQPRTA